MILTSENPSMSTKYSRVFNFSAGPANLPESVLEQVRDEMMNYKNSGMSVMEMSHRSREFDEILANANALAKELLGLEDTHEVLFLQGGASLQFAMAPMNLYQAGKPVDMVHTGYWTEAAIKELKKGVTPNGAPAEVRMVYSGESNNFTQIPELAPGMFSANASYAYVCSNNTIEGTQLKKFPKTPSPLVADMSSDFLSRRIDASQFGLIFAGAQKNLGPSGVVMAIIRRDLADRQDPAIEKVPTMLQYRTHTKAGSRYNTPPAFGIYVAGLVMNWIKTKGGLSKMEELNEKKAKLLYDAIDQSGGIFSCPVEKSVRSTMNVVWRVTPRGGMPNEELETQLISEAKKAGVIEIKGHRLVGGLRASIYNAMPIEGVQRLTDVMKEFQKKYG